MRDRNETGEVFDAGVDQALEGNFSEQRVDAEGMDYIDDGIEVSGTLQVHEWGPASTFDVLYLIHALEPIGRPSRMEIHTFAYLACLMAVYSGSPASEWGYSFSAVPPTLPFSPSIEKSLASLNQASDIARPDETTDLLNAISYEFELSVKGLDHLRLLENLTSLSPRVRFLDASAKTAVFTSVQAVANSLTFEPQLAQAISVSGPRMLLTEATTSVLYDEFSALIEVLGPAHQELVVPASLYVSFLQKRSLKALSPSTEDNQS